MPRNRSRVTDMFILSARDHTARFQSAHLQLSCAALCIALCYNFSLFVISFSPLSLPFSRHYDLQSTSHALYLRRFAFARTQPDKLVYPHPDCQPTHTAMRRHPASARFTRPVRTPSAKSAAAFAADTAARHPALPLSAPSIPASGAGECISLRSRFMWNIRLVIRQNLNVYRSFCSFMHIYTQRHYMFFVYAFAFLAPAILSPLPLRRFCFRAPNRRPACRFRRRSFAFRFSRQCLPLFDFSISFCLMPHGAPQVFVCFFCLRLFALSLR